jgi:hypothetical protein
MNHHGVPQPAAKDLTTQIYAQEGQLLKEEMQPGELHSQYFFQ